MILIIFILSMYSTTVTEEFLELFAKEDKMLFLKRHFPENELKNMTKET